MKESNFFDTLEDLRILTSQVMMGIYSAAMDGKAQSQRLWLEVVEGWKPEPTGGGNTINIGEAVIVLPNNDRENKSAPVQGWTETDWDELDEEQGE